MTRRFALFAASFAAVSLVFAAPQPAAKTAARYVAQKAGKETALDRYVKRPDPTYNWKLARTIPGDGYTAYVIDLTSQTWRKPSEIDRTVWKHWLTIVKPNTVASSTGFLFITGGSNKDVHPPDKVDPAVTQMAVATGTVTAELRMVPNQPLSFPDDGNKPLVEDEFIAYTWDKFLHGGDDEWPARLPMTKSAVRAMDTITAFCAGNEGGKTTVDKFVVAGGSKRGWTTWTTAAVDKRVIAIAPMVIDLLNIVPSFEHHWRVYGFWAPAVHDYDARGLMDWSGTKRYAELMQIVEPFSYRDRLTMPKFMINAAGDQFFIPDSSQFYFDDLKGEKHLRYVPNADHSLKGSDARESLLAFYDLVVKGKPRPEFSWKFEKDGTLRVTAKDKPSAVKLWQATNPDARDFRLEKIGPAYKSTDLTDQGGGTYVAKVAAPAKGYTAYFIELTFPTGGKYPIKFTTPVKVAPDTYPFPKFEPKQRPTD